ncbi:hypothetical protein PVAND_000236 [Polypedilum vanderplanki]|uniref:Rhodanese domain-containing protein n=1 Tax=Polypedilum vanderplanki TaxID=319348 RepID=A0A9J6BKA8_POLVA|nr:hypothetical protein PVAND_000236 [Polypedilum vanderplanki]
MASVNIAEYDEIKALPDHPEKLLIDVREPNELKETGQIPTSINIPLGQLEDELKLSDSEFQAKYQRNKPNPSDELIFHCKLGGRAQKAAEAAIGLGFTNVKNYKGSWTDWAQKENL